MYNNTRNYAVLPRTVGGLMENILNNGWNRVTEEVSAFSAPVNIQETDSTYELHLMAAGLKKEDFKLSIDKNVLHISYEQPKEKEEKTEENKEEAPKAKWLRSEFRMRSFKRSFTLSEKVDAGKIAAKYTDGILQVTLPKKEVTEPTAHEISVN